MCTQRVKKVLKEINSFNYDKVTIYHDNPTTNCEGIITAKCANLDLKTNILMSVVVPTTK